MVVICLAAIGNAQDSGVYNPNEPLPEEIAVPTLSFVDSLAKKRKQEVEGADVICKASLDWDPIWQLTLEEREAYGQVGWIEMLAVWDYCLKGELSGGEVWVRVRFVYDFGPYIPNFPKYLLFLKNTPDGLVISGYPIASAQAVPAPKTSEEETRRIMEWVWAEYHAVAMDDTVPNFLRAGRLVSMRGFPSKKSETLALVNELVASAQKVLNDPPSDEVPENEELILVAIEIALGEQNNASTLQLAIEWANRFPPVQQHGYGHLMGAIEQVRALELVDLLGTALDSDNAALRQAASSSLRACLQSVV